MARITFGFNAAVKTGDTHNSNFKAAAAVTDADLVISFDNTKVTTASQFKAYLADAVKQVLAGHGGLTP